MIKLGLKLLIFMTLACAGNVQAESSQNLLGLGTDKWAHGGLSFAMQTIGYGLTKKIFKFDANGRRMSMSDRLAASLFTATGVMMLTTLKEFMDPQPDANDILANGLGVLGAIGATLVFEF